MDLIKHAALSAANRIAQHFGTVAPEPNRSVKSEKAGHLHFNAGTKSTVPNNIETRDMLSPEKWEVFKDLARSAPTA